MTELNPGDVFAGRFKVLESTGQGSLGRSYFCEDFDTMGRRVSLKIISTRFSEAPGFVNSFVMFTKSAMQVRQPGVVNIIEIDNYSGVWYYVTEFAEGDSLKTWLKNTLSFEKRVITGLELLKKINASLKALHDAGHFGCLKPQNIILGGSGVTVKDFWIAGFIPLQEYETNESARNYLPYMAPEVKENWSRLGRLSDFYSLGALMYEIFVGKAPVGDIKIPSQCSRLYTSKVDEIVLKFIHANPDKRPQSTEEVGRLLNELLGLFIPSKSSMVPPAADKPAQAGPAPQKMPPAGRQTAGPEEIEEETQKAGGEPEETVFGAEEPEPAGFAEDSDTLMLADEEIREIEEQSALDEPAAAREDETKAIPVTETLPQDDYQGDSIDDDDIDNAFDNLEGGLDLGEDTPEEETVAPAAEPDPVSEKEPGDKEPGEVFIEESVEDSQVIEEADIEEVVPPHLKRSLSPSSDGDDSGEEAPPATINHFGEESPAVTGGESEERDSGKTPSGPQDWVEEETAGPSPVFLADEEDVETVGTRAIAEDIIPPREHVTGKYEALIEKGQKMKGAEDEEDAPPMAFAVKLLLVLLGMAVVGGSVYLGLNYTIPWK